MVYKGFGIFPFDKDLAHVRNVEDAGLLPDGKVLGNDGAILDRHVKAREGAHFRPEGDMPLVQAGQQQWLLLLVFSHSYNHI